MTRKALVKRWRMFWAKRAGHAGLSRIAARLAAIGTLPYHGRVTLSRYAEQGFIAPTAVIAHPDVRLGQNVYIGDGCYLYQSRDGGPIILADRTQVYGETIIQTGHGGRIEVGAETHIQPRCVLSAYVGPIEIGERVEIAPACAFYSYNHSVDPESDIMSQPLVTQGGIKVGDGAWLGHGVVVLDGVEIGAGAVVAAGAVVVRSIPPNAIAVGSPARVVKYRDQPLKKVSNNG